MRCIAIVAAGALATAGAAHAAPISGLEHDPPRFIDEATAFVSLLNQSDGYRWIVSADVANYGKSASPVRLDWTQGGRVLATVKCEGDYGLYKGTRGVRCKYEGKSLKATGAIDAKLVMTDDEDGKEYLIRDFKVSAARFSANAGSPVWQIVPDDLLGAGYAHHIHAQSERNGKVGFMFWTAARNGSGVEGQLRCTVDGTKLDDLPGTFEQVGTQNQGEPGISADIIPAHGARVTYYWWHFEFVPNHMYYGTEDRKANGAVVLGQHAGAWECDIRKDHEVVRQIKFAVDANGMIQSAPMQQGKGAVPLVDDIALIELHVPKGSKFDQRIRPDAMKKSRGFGLPWPDDPSVKAIHATFPPSSGLADPH
jgi:hypothetical protein